jgi:integrase
VSNPSKRRHVGIEVRHNRNCASKRGGNCSCQPAYRAEAWSARDQRRIRKTFPTLAAARAWRHDAAVAIRRGTLSLRGDQTLADAAAEWLAGARAGAILTRSGDPYKPSAIRAYDEALRMRVLPELGKRKLCELTRVDLQRFVGRLMGLGLGASTVRNTLIPVRAIYRHAIAYGEVSLNPATGLQLPAVRGMRDRVAAPEEASKLLELVPDRDRAIWATTMYAGLRRGELLALRWSDIDFDRSLIHVERGWDMYEGIIGPKSRAGTRTVPMVRALRAHLAAHQLLTGARRHFVFGRSEDLPFNERAVSNRANKAWAAAGLTGITLHECRHTYASLMIAAGVNAKALSSYMGHSSVTITLDRYGHLFPGNESEAANLLDAYLARR